MKSASLVMLVLLSVDGCAPAIGIALESPSSVITPRKAQIQPDLPIGSPLEQPMLKLLSGTGPIGSPNAIAQEPANDEMHYVDADIRDVAAQILGEILHMTYVIDPAVHGTTTIKSAHKLTHGEILLLLQAALAENGAALVVTDRIARVVPLSVVSASGSKIVILRDAKASDVYKLIQPLASNNVKVLLEVALNAIVISGDPTQTGLLEQLIHSVDLDQISEKSFAILTTPPDQARDLSVALREAFKTNGGEDLNELVRIVPLPRLNAIFLVASQPRYIEVARRLVVFVEHQREVSIRRWHNVHLKHMTADTVLSTLQSAFTPGNMSGTSRAPRASTITNPNFSQLPQQEGSESKPGNYGTGAANLGAAGSSDYGPSSGALMGRIAVSSADVSVQSDARARPLPAPLIGAADDGLGDTTDTEGLRILPSGRDDLLLVYGTESEVGNIKSLLDTLDVPATQVRIDATIAEVTLNDQLQYGTQFFFKAGGVNGALNNAANTASTIVSAALANTFPGFVIGGVGQGGAPLALSALQAVTKVNVLSSPQLMVIDNQAARFQVGSEVPYLNATSQSVLTSGAPVVNTISYKTTGVIMNITPRISGGGTVTLDITQEVSDVSAAQISNGIQSPTFDKQYISTRVAILDGQTIGIAGLIRETGSEGNSGIPWLKDVPLLGVLAGTQINQHVRTELLVLITPRIVRSEIDAQESTDELRRTLQGAANAPIELKRATRSGSPDPNAKVWDALRDRSKQ